MRSLFAWRSTTAAAIAFAAALLQAGEAHAQFTEVAAGAGATFEAYRFTNSEEVRVRDLRLLTTPVRAAVDLGIARLDVSSAFARGELTRPDGTSSSLTGPTDTHVALTVPLAGRWLSLTAFVVAPTGTTLSGEGEAEVAGVVAADLLPLSISNWGAGGGAGVAAAVRRPIGASTASFGASYMLSGEHDAAEDAGFVRYQAGDQLGARVGLESPVGRAGNLSLEVRFQHLGDDRQRAERDGRPVCWVAGSASQIDTLLVRIHTEGPGSDAA